MTRNALHSYAQNGIEVGVESSTPQQLISMLYEGALLAITTAKINLKQGNIAARGKAISHAISIISSGLKASINLKEGGVIAQDLKGLYEYMVFRLLDANLKADLAPLDEVESLLLDLKGAWDSIGKLPVVKAPVADMTPRPAVRYGSA